MKKTLLALLALASVASAAEDITLNVATSGNFSQKTGFGAFDFSIGSNSAFSASSGTTVDYNAYNAAVVNSVTLNVAKTWYTNSHADIGFAAAIFKQTAGENGSTTWSLVGKTNWWNATATSYEGDVTLTLQGSGCTLTLGETYTIAFIANTGYFNSLTLGSTRTSMTGAKEWKGGTVPTDAGDSSLAAIGVTCVDHGVNSTSGITTYLGDSTSSTNRYTPNASFSVTLCNVPEPGVATLSFLALAGGLLRRRRRG